MPEVCCPSEGGPRKPQPSVDYAAPLVPLEAPKTTIRPSPLSKIVALRRFQWLLRREFHRRGSAPGAVAAAARNARATRARRSRPRRTRTCLQIEPFRRLGVRRGVQPLRVPALRPRNSTATGRWGPVSKMPDLPGKREGEPLNCFSVSRARTVTARTRGAARLYTAAWPRCYRTASEYPDLLPPRPSNLLHGLAPEEDVQHDRPDDRNHNHQPDRNEDGHVV